MVFLSLSEVSDRLGVSYQRAHYLWITGRFPNSQRVGNQIIIPIDDVESVEADRKAKGVA